MKIQPTKGTELEIKKAIAMLPPTGGATLPFLIVMLR
jgi:hypothetical protein